MMGLIMAIIIIILILFCMMEGIVAFINGMKTIKRNCKKKRFINKEAYSNKEEHFMRIYQQLPCGCLVSEDGGGALIPCCYPEIGEQETELHKECMKLYFEENKTVKEIIELFERKQI